MAFATIGTTGIADDAVTSAKVAPGVVDTEAQPNQSPIIINGSMNVWQRSTSTVTMSDGYYNVDRYRGENNVASSAATWSRSTSVPDNTGLPYSLQVDCTTADSTIASGEQCGIQHTIEAQNIAGLVKYGTSDAEKITIAFWCKSNQTGQHSVALRKLDNTQYCQPKTYTISSADTWEKKVLTFSALTSTGGAINQDNGDGLQIHWKLSAGSSYQGTADTWTQTNQGATAVSGDVNFLSSTDNNFYLTGVQLEIGEFTSSTIPPFKHESYGDNLFRCQRYFQNIADGTDKPLGMGQYWEAQEFIGHRVLSTDMRVAPTLEYVTSTNYYGVLRDGGSDQIDALTISSSPKTTSMITWYMGSSQGLASNTKNRPGFIRTQNASSKVAFTAEL